MLSEEEDVGKNPKQKNAVIIYARSKTTQTAGAEK
jgi:hypothetical protein